MPSNFEIESFKTLLGGITTVIVRLLILAISVSLMVTIFQRSNTSKTTSSTIKDLSVDTEKHYIGKSTFAFAMKMIGPNPVKLLDTSYFTLRVYQSR